MRIAVLQMHARAGDPAANLNRSDKAAPKAAAGGAVLLIAPELALTGYLLQDLVPDVAMAADDPRLRSIGDGAPGATLASARDPNLRLRLDNYTKVPVKLSAKVWTDPARSQPDVVAAVTEVARDHVPIALELAEAGRFGRRVLWAGIDDDPPEAVATLGEQVQATLAAADRLALSGVLVGPAVLYNTGSGAKYAAELAAAGL